MLEFSTTMVKHLLEAGKYKKAAEEFEKVYFQHPGDPLTPQAELMEAYSLYLDGKYEDACRCA
jgi:outer membrane protein assembly factor BamD